MKIIIDAMGGDHAPEEIVRGAVRAHRELGVDITLVGRAEAVRECLKSEGCEELEIVDARDVITMEDDPSTATRRKKDASMTVALNLLKDFSGENPRVLVRPGLHIGNTVANKTKTKE